MMADTCSNCGQGISQNARFCRHCGASQTTETEKTVAQTQQYGHAVPRRYPTTETPSPGWLYESQAPDTSRIGQAQNAVYAVPQPVGSPAKFWFFISALCVLLIMGVASSAFFAARNLRQRQQAEKIFVVESHEEAMEKAAEQMAEEIAKATEDAEQAAKDAAALGVPAPPIPPLAPIPPIGPGPDGPRPPKGPGPNVLRFDELMYPGATVIKRIGGLRGTFVATLQTSDSLKKVQDFYSKRLGNATASKEGAVFFEQRRAGQTIVKISPLEEGEESDGKVEIVVVRTGTRDPGEKR